MNRTAFLPAAHYVGSFCVALCLSMGTPLPATAQFIGQYDSPAHKALQACTRGVQEKSKGDESTEPEERRKSYERAMNDLQQCTSSYPLNFDGWLALGQTCAALGNRPAALSACKRAQQLKPDSDEVNSCVKDAMSGTAPSVSGSAPATEPGTAPGPGSGSTEARLSSGAPAAMLVCGVAAEIGMNEKRFRSSLPSECDTKKLQGDAEGFLVVKEQDNAPVGSIQTRNDRIISVDRVWLERGSTSDGRRIIERLYGALAGVGQMKTAMLATKEIQSPETSGREIDFVFPDRTIVMIMNEDGVQIHEVSPRRLPH